MWDHGEKFVSLNPELRKPDGSFRLQVDRKLLSKIPFTLHQKDINICSLKTCTGEELTPLFTTLHHSSPGAAYRKICVNLWNLWDIKKVVSAPQPNRASFRFNSVRNPKVKRGEEWYVTLHLSQPQCLSGFQPIWWRVKSKKKSGAFIKKTPDVSFCARQWQVIALVRGNVVP